MRMGDELRQSMFHGTDKEEGQQVQCNKKVTSSIEIGEADWTTEEGEGGGEGCSTLFPLYIMVRHKIIISFHDLSGGIKIRYSW